MAAKFIGSTRLVEMYPVVQVKMFLSKNCLNKKNPKFLPVTDTPKIDLKYYIKERKVKRFTTIF